ncbi:hypothetical protein EK21DRAFT_106594 [Setomelanomma holmii]|uniref:Uncharacterized protein n=1 Tax=Setomelanomma holmii TaxID=210430 RepID=A0A9P4LRV6_9PLEO|nr:hypothetical protein EK21DRAFT_106594 [Setomelanomma holmii]
MPNLIENEWTIIDPNTNNAAPKMASNNDNSTPTKTAEPVIELTIKSKPKATEDKTECTCKAGMPALERQDSIESMTSIDLDRRRPIRRRTVYDRRYSPSPIRIRDRTNDRAVVPIVSSSTKLLDQVGKCDGIVDLPFPARGSIFMTTCPFTQKDVKKFAWLFSLGVEETFLKDPSRGRGRDLDSDDSDGEQVVRRARNRSPFYDPGTVDIPSVYLSRALEKEVVPEDTKAVSYLIVTQNRHRPAGSKLLVAESRKAAGILMYYEALKGDSIVFVGAVVAMGEKKVHPKKFRVAESLNEANELKEQEVALIARKRYIAVIEKVCQEKQKATSSLARDLAAIVYDDSEMQAERAFLSMGDNIIREMATRNFTTKYAKTDSPLHDYFESMEEFANDAEPPGRPVIHAGAFVDKEKSAPVCVAR